MAKAQPKRTAHEFSMTEAPPQSVGGILRKLGPGLIIAASIVGSGELIGTTKTGAEAGFTLLWLILIGCVIKVFVQVEFGRYSICQGRTTIEALNDLPGPRLRFNWLVWYWLAMFLASTGQLGGIVGGVGQSMALTVPITGDFLQVVDEEPRLKREQTDYDRRLGELTTLLEQEGRSSDEARRRAADRLGTRPAAPYTRDDVYWSGIITFVTAILLVVGRYRLVQTVATLLVAAFTLVTVFDVLILPLKGIVEINLQDVLQGLTFRLPPAVGDASPLATALATFGIIGVGAAELITYPYWCLEKGYARFTGPRDDSTGWAERARGWLRVLRWDAWCSMVVYTFATVAFYILGASVLHQRGLNPSGNQMIRVLSQMYADVFAPWGDLIFLGGAFAVLYSTFFVATAGNARIAADALRIFREERVDDVRLHVWVRRFCAALPFVSFGIYLVSKDPVGLVLLSGIMQSIMLPLLGGAALYYRYKSCDPRVAPSKTWDFWLWLSVFGLAIAGVWGAGDKLLHVALPALRHLF